MSSLYCSALRNRSDGMPVADAPGSLVAAAKANRLPHRGSPTNPEAMSWVLVARTGGRLTASTQSPGSGGEI